MDNKEKKERATIVNHNHNCQVFNGDMNGCVFAMPGSHVDNRPVQVVQGNNHSPAHDNACTDDASSQVQGDTPHEEEPQGEDEEKIPEERMPRVRETANKLFAAPTDNVLNMVYAAARKCNKPLHFALLYQLCEDDNLVRATNSHKDFADIINTMLNLQEGTEDYLKYDTLRKNKNNIYEYFLKPGEHQKAITECRHFYGIINRVFTKAKGVKLQRKERCRISI